ncbi:uncharacterized protein LOC117640003 [Thrips palmi]|uniref:Uncharacterized protein LOC117640003 n=1 Tax=Thrips palmi TaxID=161013 RepID=A0A6P8Y7K9_THRPL|nr:uncharacterized protein LOC117640003 [Thrips palmi]
MPLCCVDIAVGARMVAVLGVVTSTVVVAQLASELARGTGDGGVAVLLGLSLDELDSKQRHSLHRDHHDHHGPFKDGVDAEPQPFDPFVRDVLAGFLAFAALYWTASVLLARTTIKTLRWGALPWLLLQALSVASQIARVVVQVAQYGQFVSDAKHPLRYVHPMAPHPYHKAEDLHAWEEHARQHEQQRDEDAERAALVHIAVTAIYLLVNAYTWLVVLVAHRRWSSSEKPQHRHAGPGDEGYCLSTLASKEPLRSDEV